MTSPTQWLDQLMADEDEWARTDRVATLACWSRGDATIESAMLKLADYAKMTSPERDVALKALFHGPDARTRLNAEVLSLEREHGMTSAEMRRRVREEGLDTEWTARWLVLLEALGRREPT
jgi:hypothetical protein